MKLQLCDYMSTNQHVTEYIQHYTSLDKPGYALLITGPWGCGKTYFIDSYIHQYEKTDSVDQLKFLKISLFGLQSISDIEDKFFQILSPVLSNKYVVFGGRLTKALLNTIRFDVGEDNQASISSDISKVRLFKKIPEVDKTVIVFDDLERCSIPIVELMGYLNSFVEKGGYKLIIIAAENILNEIDKKQEIESTFSSYFQTKEKLIGKTLEVTPDVSFVIDSLIEDFSQELQSLFNENKIHISKVLDCSGYRNLRSLKKSLEDFKRLWCLLDDEVKSKPDLMQEFLTLFMILSFEFYAGSVKGKEFEKIIGSSGFIKSISSDSKNEDLKNDKFENISNKYQEYSLSLFSHLIPIQFWSDYFEKGYISRSEINKELKSTKYFENVPDWKKLWYLYDLDESNFDELLKQVISKLENHECVFPGEIQQIVGILLHLTENSIKVDFGCEKSVIEYFKSYIDKIAESQKLVVEKLDHFGEPQTGYSNLGFYEHENPKFIEIRKYLAKKINESNHKKLKEEAKTILSVMKENTEEIYSLLSNSVYSSGKYESIAILHFIDVNTFFNTFLSLSNSKKRLVADAIHYRYKKEIFGKHLVDEVNWCEELINLLENEVVNAEGKISFLPLNEATKKIKHAYSKLKEYEEINNS